VRVAGLNNPITYWPPAAENQFGVRTYGMPILIEGRWEEKQEEVNTIGGKFINSKAIVYVDQDLQVNGYLAKGDATGQPSDPTTLPFESEILAYFEDPDLRSCSKLRKAVL
jgi:hypothetical protein